MSTNPSNLQNVENHLATFAHIVRADVDKALPFVARIISVAGSIWPLVGSIGSPLIAAVIKAEASVNAPGQGANKLASVIAAVGPQVQQALNASGHAAQGATVESTIEKVVKGLQEPTAVDQVPAVVSAPIPGVPKA